MTQEQKRIIFINRVAPDSPESESLLKIIERLNAEYCVETMPGLNRWSVRGIDEDFAEGKGYGALITHMPPESISWETLKKLSHEEKFHAIYNVATNLTSYVKAMHPSIHIIAYTDADNNEIVRKYFKEEGNVEEFVSKTSDWQTDARNLEQVLEKLLSE